MPLAKRIIPTILVRGRQMVKGMKFDSWRSVGLAAQAARVHSMRGVDELMILDVHATNEGRGPDLGLVEELSETCFMPLAVGGGVRTVEDARALLRAGADKVVICSGGSSAVQEIAHKVGKQAVIASIDYQTQADGSWTTFTRSGTRPGPMLPVVLADMLAAGAGEILLNAIDREGTLEGYDLSALELVAKWSTVPVIASCGAGTYKHMLEAVEAGANAVAAGAIYQFTDATPRGAVEYLHMAGVEVRL